MFCGGTLWLVGFLYQLRHREGQGFERREDGGDDRRFSGTAGCGVDADRRIVAGRREGLCYIWFTGKDASTYELPFGTFLQACGKPWEWVSSGSVLLPWQSHLSP